MTTLKMVAGLSALVLGAALSSCGYPRSATTSSSTTTPVLSAKELATSTSETIENPKAVISNFRAESFDTYEAAEAEARYHILRPAAEYLPSHVAILLRYERGVSLPFTTTQYVYQPIAPHSVEVDMATSEYWGQGVFDAGTPASFGGRSGFMVPGHPNALVFAFKCGRVDHQDLWCKVTAPSSMGQGALEDFVASLR